MNSKIEQINAQNQEALDNFFREAQRIICCQAPVKAKIRMLHGARYWAGYFLQLNALRLEEAFRCYHWQAKLRLETVKSNQKSVLNSKWGFGLKIILSLSIVQFL